MTTRKDVEEALVKIDNVEELLMSLIELPERNGLIPFVKWSVEKEFKMYRKALQEKLEQMEKSDEDGR